MSPGWQDVAATGSLKLLQENIRVAETESKLSEGRHGLTEWNFQSQWWKGTGALWEKAGLLLTMVEMAAYCGI